MLQIDETSLSALESAHRATVDAELLNALADYLVEPLQLVPADELAALVRTWHERGLSHGIRDGRGIERFLALHLTLRPDFDLEPPVLAFLELEGMTGDQKMQALFTRLKVG